MNKNGIIWIFFKKEVLGFTIGFIAGTVLTYLVAKNVIPIGFNLCG